MNSDIIIYKCCCCAAIGAKRTSKDLKAAGVADYMPGGEIGNTALTDSKCAVYVPRFARQLP